MSQTSFKLYSDRFAVGQIADNSVKQIDSFISSTVISFGAPVSRTVVNNVISETNISLLSSITAGSCMGFAIRNNRQVTGQYEISKQVDVLRFGRIIVVTKEVVTVDQVAYVYADATIGKTQANGLAVGNFVTNSIVQNIEVNGVITPLNLAELQIQLLKNA